MRILVTGGAGFIGSHLCRYLLALDHEVICVDNLFTGHKRNIYNLMNNKHFEFIRHDLIHPISIEVDQIYNLACPASPIQYQKNPVKTIKMNTVAMANLLDLALNSNARILQSSTSEIYGDPKEHPQKESYWGNVNPLGPRACYDEGKRVAETLMMAYHYQYGSEIRIARIFNTYGPNMDKNDGRVISNFILQSIQHKPITLYGSGNQTRSFCYISDMIQGLVKLMNYKSYPGPINLGNPLEYTIRDIALLIKTITKSKSRIVKKPLPINDPKQRKPDISKAKRILQWHPAINIEVGLIKTINWFKKQYL